MDSSDGIDEDAITDMLADSASQIKVQQESNWLDLQPISVPDPAAVLDQPSKPIICYTQLRNLKLSIYVSYPDKSV